MDWKDITLNLFLDIQEALKLNDEQEQLIRLSEIVFGDEVLELNLTDFAKKTKELAFLKTELPDTHIIKKVKVRGREYELNGLLGNISTAQYLDFINHNKEGNTAKILSVFFVPVGHKYNDGYDMLQVIDDMGWLPVDIVNSTAFFFRRQLEKFMTIFQSSLTKKIKRTKDLTKEQKEILLK